VADRGLFGSDIPLWSLDVRELLLARGALDRVRLAHAEGRLARALPTPFFDHIGDVLERVERVEHASTGCGEWLLKLTALVHEERPARIAKVLEPSGLAVHTPFIAGILAAFGEVWRVRDADARAAFVRRHGPLLEPILRFEAAHEGHVTDAMAAVAACAGIADRVPVWSAALSPESR
jgi:hypothetical protein